MGIRDHLRVDAARHPTEEVIDQPDASDTGFAVRPHDVIDRVDVGEDRCRGPDRQRRRPYVRRFRGNNMSFAETVRPQDLDQFPSKIWYAFASRTSRSTPVPTQNPDPPNTWIASRLFWTAARTRRSLPSR